MVNPSIQFFIGTTVSLVASALGSISVNIQALALKDETLTIESDSNAIERFWFHYRWHVGKFEFKFQFNTIIGFIMYLIVSTTGSVVSLSFIPPVILAPLGAIGLIFNIFSSYWLLGTVIRKSDWIGTLLIMAGCALISVFGASVPNESMFICLAISPKDQSLDDLIRLFSRPTFIIFFSIQIGVMFILTCVAIWQSHKLEQLKHQTHERTRLLNGFNQEASDTDFTDDSSSIQDDYDEMQVYLKSISQDHNNTVGILFGIISGIVGSQGLLVAKSGIGLLIISVIDSNNQFKGKFALFLLAMLIVIVIWQLYAFNKCLYHSLPTLVIPISYTFHTCFSLINSLVYMDQLTGVYSASQFTILCTGLLFLITGVWELKH